MARALAFTILFLFSVTSYSTYVLPSQLDSYSEEKVAQNFGFGTATKMAADPLPLGGYEGLQFSISRDFVDVSGLKNLSGASKDNYFSTTTIMIGKGLYYDVDMYFQMTPPQNNEYAGYGALLRAQLYNFESIPVHLGALVHGSVSQFSNIFGSNIFGYDIYTYLALGRFTWTVGLGQAKGIHNYIGSGLVAGSGTENVKVDLTTSHVWTGLSVHIQRWIVSINLEDYFDILYSTKLTYAF